MPSFILLLLALALLILVLAPSERFEGGAQAAVVGGTHANIADFPWFCALYDLKMDDKPQFLCGGSLVAPNLVLTAAHCVVFGGYDQKLGTLAVSVGGGENIPVEKIFLPPGALSRQRTGFDVAILRLARPSKATPIRLASSVPPHNTRVTIMGRGFKSQRNPNAPDTPLPPYAYSQHFTKADLLYVNKETLSQIIQRERLHPVDREIERMNVIKKPDIITFVSYTGKSGCPGDSGGPAVVRTKNGYELLGATHGGPDGCNYGRRVALSVYSSVPFFRHWIDSVIRRNRV